MIEVSFKITLEGVRHVDLPSDTKLCDLECLLLGVYQAESLERTIRTKDCDVVISDIAIGDPENG